MPEILWSIDGLDLRLTDRGVVGVHIQWPGQSAISIPPRTLGAWPLPVPNRAVILRTVRNLDVVQFELWSDGHFIPRTRVPLRPSAAPPDSKCANHAEALAACVCLRCGTFVCRACAPDGARCSRCLAVQAQEDRKRVLRLRWIGMGGGLALGAALAALGRWQGWPRVFSAGFGTCALVVFLWGRGLFNEWRDRQQGRPTALDSPPPKG